ncbi:hypothetical protein FRC10_008311 [Ceratobasidium sp. 414]|nr:hypothetical protein FRC10_008311 [Ceratobasidium sp. 414]
MEPYDPRVPNDYYEYKTYKQKEREDYLARRQAELREESRGRKRSWKDGGNSEDSEDASEDSRDYDRWQNRPRKTGRYERSASRSRSASPSRSPRPSFGNRDSSGPRAAPSFTPPSFAPASASVDSAPLALSGEEAYLRRLALSTKAANTAAPPASEPSVITTGDEAYARRLAMSQAPAQPSAPVEPKPAYPGFAPSTQPQAPPAPVDDDPIPSPPLDTPPIPVPAATPAAPTSGPGSAEFEAQVKARRDAAVAIAARLAQMANAGPSQPPAPVTQSSEPPQSDSNDKPDPHGFAARLMAKWGHKTGQGLGVNATGIVQPLVVEQTTRPKGNKGGSGGFGSKDSGNMGRIINANDDVRQKEELERFGEPSRIVVLSNMIGVEDIGDEELPDEVAQECTKHGVVERVFVHGVYPAPPLEEDSVRVFVKFSGPVGAYKTVRDFDGRFFGGRPVRARYFDERLFESRQFNVPL